MREGTLLRLFQLNIICKWLHLLGGRIWQFNDHDQQNSQSVLDFSKDNSWDRTIILEFWVS